MLYFSVDNLNICVFLAHKKNAYIYNNFEMLSSGVINGVD